MGFDDEQQFGVGTGGNTGLSGPETGENQAIPTLENGPNTKIGRRKKLDEKRAALAKQLAEIEHQIRREKERESARQKQLDDRAKVLIGVAVLTGINSSEPAVASVMKTVLKNAPQLLTAKDAEFLRGWLNGC